MSDETITFERIPGYPISYAVFLGDERIGVVGKPEGRVTGAWITEPATAEFITRDFATKALLEFHKTGEWIP